MFEFNLFHLKNQNKFRKITIYLYILLERKIIYIIIQKQMFDIVFSASLALKYKSFILNPRLSQDLLPGEPRMLVGYKVEFDRILR
jgi:hypothetical protein